VEASGAVGMGRWKRRNETVGVGGWVGVVPAAAEARMKRGRRLGTGDRSRSRSRKPECGAETERTR
jgi:hypothetical protein